jgi:streptogramin lyase
VNSFKKSFLLLGLLAMAGTSHSQVYNWTTIAGDAGAGATDGTNTDARFYQPVGAVADTNGNFYVADVNNNTIRKLTPNGTNWVTTTIAGSPGNAGSADGTNAAAWFYGPSCIAVDKAGNLFVTDYNNSTIRKLTPVAGGWAVTTIAGLALGTGTVDGTNSTARFNRPVGIAVDANGVLYVADFFSDTIRTVTPVGTNWVVTTIAGLALSSAHQDGTNSAARFTSPYGITVDTSGTVYVADRNDNTIRQLKQSGTNWVVTTLAGTIYTAGYFDGTNSSVKFNAPSAIVPDGAGNFYIADRNNSLIRKLTAVGTNWVASTLAGLVSTTGTADGTNSDARFYFPTGIARDAAGKLLVVDTFSSLIRQLTSSGTNWVVRTIAGLYALPGSSNGIDRAARFNLPVGVAMDANGNLYVGDYANDTIRKLAPSGSHWIVSTIVGVPLTNGYTDGTNNSALLSHPEGVAMDKNGNLYVADLGNAIIRKFTPSGTNWVSSTIAGTVLSFSEVDGTNSAARFYQNFGITVGTNGSVFVADLGGRTIRRLTPMGTNWVVTTIAGTAFNSDHVDGTNNAALFAAPIGVAADASGNLFVADPGDQTIRKLSPAGTNWVVTTIAGSPYITGAVDGTNTDALFNAPIGIAVDSSGKVYVTEDGSWTIRQLTPVGTNWVVVTIGGVADGYGNQDGLTGVARFYRPQGIIVDSAGNLYVADTYNSIIRKGAPVSAVAQPFFQSVKLTNGTVAFTWSAVPGSMYQVQYNTNLAQTTWINLGRIVNATNAIMPGTDSLVPGLQRFYRIQLLP